MYNQAPSQEVVGYHTGNLVAWPNPTSGRRSRARSHAATHQAFLLAVVVLDVLLLVGLALSVGRTGLDGRPGAVPAPDPYPSHANFAVVESQANRARLTPAVR